MMQLPLPLCQRWRAGASSWRRGEEKVDPSRHGVEVIPERIARAFGLLRQVLPQVRGVVSYSDPLRRTTEDGRVVMPGHVGVVYQAFNGAYLGRGKPRALILDRWGRVVSERGLSKIRLGERGQDYAARRLLEAGAPARRPGEDAAAWVARALAEGPFRRVRHPGNHCYAWAVGDRAVRREVTRRLPQGRPYPKMEAGVPGEEV